jgi:hypothetical protein
MRWLDFEFDFNMIAWNLLCSTHKLRWALSKPTLVIKCHSLVVCLTKMSDDSCIWCHALVRLRQEAVECDICSRWHHRKCGNMGYVQYKNFRFILVFTEFINFIYEIDLIPESSHLSEF